MSQSSQITFIDDLHRHQFWPAKEFFYDLLRVPVMEATSVKPGLSVRGQLQRAGRLPRQDPGKPDLDGPWLDSYQQLTPEAEKLYAPFLSGEKIYFSYEMTPGLRLHMDEKGLRYVDFRLSPLRFMQDLLIAVRTNVPELRLHLSQLAVAKMDVWEAAGRLRADFLHRHRNVPQVSDSFEGAAVFIGQTEGDTSLVANGNFARIDDCLEWVAAKSAGSKLIYTPHPYATPKHAQHELAMLRTVDPECEILGINVYDLFCLEDEFEVLGLSSGALYEAVYFDKPSTAFLPPICPPCFAGENLESGGYAHLALDDFANPDFIRCALGQTVPATRRPLRNIRPNALRELHNAWWSYADHIVKDRQFWFTVRHPVHASIAPSLAFIMSALGERSPDANAFLQELPSHAWAWFNSGPTIFTSDGSVTQNGQVLGSFAVASAAEREIIVVWQGGLWIDRLKFAPDWSMISAINNHGNPFKVLPMAAA